MVRIMHLLEDFNAFRWNQKRLKKVQEEALKQPENPFTLVRMGDLLAKLKKKKEAARVYELAAHQYIQKNLFAHAIALKKIIFRLEPPMDDGEAMKILDRLYEQMLVYREKASIEEEATPPQSPAPPSRPAEKRGGGLQLEPRAIPQSAS